MTLPGQRYVSSELAHFVGRKLQQEEQYQRLLKILNDGWITHPPHNPNISGNLSVKNSIPFSSNEMYAPQIVCFCDIPLADLGIHVSKYSPFGLSFSKDFIVRKGGCSVFYIPLKTNVRAPKNPNELMRLMQEGDPDALFDNISKSQYFDQMIRECKSLIDIFRKFIRENQGTPGISGEYPKLTEVERFLDFHIFSYIKFYNHTHPDDHDDNYYLEREWRVVGNVKFSLSEVETIFMPKSFAQRFRADCPLYNSQLVFV